MTLRERIEEVLEVLRMGMTHHMKVWEGSTQVILSSYSVPSDDRLKAIHSLTEALTQLDALERDREAMEELRLILKQKSPRKLELWISTQEQDDE